MKRHRRPSKNHRFPGKSAPVPKADETHSSPRGTISRRRQVVFRLVAASLVPLAILAAVEVALRIGGYGYPAGFFLKRQIDGRKVLIENEKFSRRFFPPHLVRRPLPLAMDVTKATNTYRIFVLGESAAMGDPDPAFSFSRILEVLLRERYPSTRFEVVNVAFTAINSHVIRQLAKDCAGQQGDLWILYLGNNEVVGPFGAGTVFSRRAPSLTLIRAELALKATRIGQALDALLNQITGGTAASKSWRGMRMFTEHPLAEGDASLQRVYEQFRSNLADILGAGRNSGAKVIVSTVASNLKDFAPLLSIPAPQLNPGKRSAWDQAYQQGIALESSGQFSESLQHYLRAAVLEDRSADLQFRLGRCYVGLTNYAQARRCFERARDLDALRFRADSRLNEIISTLAAKREAAGIYFVDAAASLGRASAVGIAGDELFFDHVHLNFEGNYELGRAFADEVAKLLPPTVIASANTNWAPQAVCAQRLALTGWNRYHMQESMFSRLSGAPFTNQLNHLERQKKYQERLAELKAFLKPAALQEAAETYRQALANAPDDPYLRQNFGRLLYEQHDPAEAIAQFQHVIRLWPHHAASYYNIGHALESQGKPAEAQAYYSRALKLRPDFAEALNGQAGLLARQGKTEAAIADYQRALRDNPEFAEAHLNLGLAWQQLGQTSNALASFMAAVRLAPNSLSAHTNLANLLSDEGELFEANGHYAEAVRLQPKLLEQFSSAVQSRPEDPLAYFKLANALAVQNERAQAQQLLRVAIRLKPDFWQARYLLGVDLAMDGKILEAEEQFAEVIRLRPDFALAHLNLGVSLVRERQFLRARGEFYQTLRLEPTNQLAQHHLKTLEAMLARQKLN